MLEPTCSFDQPETIVNITDHKAHVLISPRWPYYYTNLLNCVWLIEAPASWRLLAHVLSISIENGYDFLHIGMGHTPPDGFVWSATGDPKIQLLFSFENTLWLILSTDYEGRRSGFAMQIEIFNEKGKTTCIIYLFAKPNYRLTVYELYIDHAFDECMNYPQFISSFG